MFQRKKSDAAALAERLSPWSGSQEDQAAWERWLAFRKRIWHDFRGLLEGETRPAIKVRALTAMLCGDASFDPFGGREKSEFAGSSTISDGRELSKLDADLLSAAGVIVGACLDAIDAGLGKWSSLHSPRDQYNRMIPRILAGCGDDLVALGLFKQFRLRDSGAPYDSMEDVSGYNAFDGAFYTQGLSDEWKRRIDGRMREVVSEELAGRSKPRVEHEAADGWYAHAVLLCLYGDTMNRSMDLFEDQLRFIASWPRWSGKVLRDVRLPLDRLFNRLQGRDAPGSACHAILRRAILDEGADGPYAIQSLALARRWLEVYGPADPELDARLRALLTAAAPRLEAQTREQEARRKKEDELDATLR